MKKSKLLAHYWAYGEDIIPVTRREYLFMAEGNNIDEFTTMRDTVSTTFRAGGHAYYAFKSTYYAASSESDTYYFKLKCGTGEMPIPPQH